MSEPLLLVERDAGVATVRFNDAARLNAMTQAMGEAIAERMAELAGDASIHAVVVTGAGRAFSAGGDLDMIDRLSREGIADVAGAARARNQAFMRHFYGLYLSIRALPQPSVAAIHGHAVGAGCCVALACDARVASREAKLGLNFARLGIHPGMAATWTLPRLVGPAHAADLLFTGRLLDGVEAERIGLVNRALPTAEVLPEALAMARAMAENAPLAVRGAKQALSRSLSASLEEQLDFEAEQQALCYETRDLREGLAAAREKRRPRFDGH